MIHGYYSAAGGRRRPYVKASFRFPSIRDQGLEVELLVDTGADRTILAPLDALRLSRRFRVDLTTLLAGTRSTGIGGTTPTRIVEAVLNLETVALPLTLTTLEPTAPISPIPSLLGRDILAHFALFLEERTSRVLLLEPAEADALDLP